VEYFLFFSRDLADTLLRKFSPGVYFNAKLIIVVGKKRTLNRYIILKTSLNENYSKQHFA
jgi:hypothetical protein